jgi:hypothetical protein
MAKIIRQILQHGRSGRIKSRALWLGALAIAAALLLNSYPCSQASAHTEYEVKAAYLYNFGLFVRWPAQIAPSPSGPFTICVMGMDPFGKVLDRTVAGETIGSQSVVGRRIVNPEEALGCRVLFISSSEETGVKAILAALGKASVLTVGDMPQFVEHGGIIQFVTENSRVRFEINLAAAERAGLSLSSQLLKLAIRVKGAAGLGANR